MELDVKEIENAWYFINGYHARLNEIGKSTNDPETRYVMSKYGFSRNVIDYILNELAHAEK